MNQSQDQRLIADIKRVLDNQPLDEDSRFTLQKARAHALELKSKPSQQIPWLPLAVTASLITVLAINLPDKSPGPSFVSNPSVAEVAINNPPLKMPAKPIALVAEKPTVIKPIAIQPSVDADLLENLELYEDAEFYQWLSEQDTQGATDA